MTVHTLQINGTRGELTPLMHGRVDTDFYQAGWHTALNMIISRYGSMVRMPGTLFRSNVKFADRLTRHLPFEFNEEQVYAMEFGHEYVRFRTRDGNVLFPQLQPFTLTPAQSGTIWGYAASGPLGAISQQPLSNAPLNQFFFNSTGSTGTIRFANVDLVQQLGGWVPSIDGVPVTVVLPWQMSGSDTIMMFSAPPITNATPREITWAGPDNPYEIWSPYTEDDLPFLITAQSGDAVYIWCRNRRPRILRRLGETNWSMVNYEPKDGPYMAINDSDTVMTPVGTGRAHPVMTGNSAPAPYVVASSNSSATAWRVFTRERDVDETVAAGPSGWISIDLGEARVVDNYWLMSGAKNAETDSMFSQWDFQGSNNGTDWLTLDNRNGETGWAGSETRYFEFPNKTAYRYYRIQFSGGAGFDPDHTTTEMGQLALGRAAADQVPFALDLSDDTINNGQGFVASDVGRAIRLQGSDSRWRWFEITAVNSATQVLGRLHGYPLPNVDPISAWRLGAWSNQSGWPSIGRFYEDRLTHASTDADPLGVWMSVIAGYDQFRVSQPIVDDDALSLRLTGGTFSRAHWLAEGGALLAGTGSVLRSVGSRDAAGVLSPTNVRQRSETTTASSRVQPAEIETVVLFIDRYQQRLFEAAYTYEADGYLTREISILNEHLFGVGVEQVAWLDTPHKMLVCRRSDGKLIMFSYDREQKVAGATLVDFADPVEDIMALPGPRGTDLFLVVERSIGTTVRRYAELLAPFWRADYPNDYPPIFGGCSYVYSGAPTSTLSGISALNGYTVGVWADGRDIGDALVTSGNMELPHGLTASEVIVGRRLPWKLQTLRVANYGQRDGAGLGRQMKVLNASIDMFETAGIALGSLSHVDTMRFEDEAEEDPSQPKRLRTGMWPMPVDDSWQNQGVFVMQGDKMYPVTVRGISLNVDGEP